ncbi:MAG: hypothetical protein KJO11_07820 [Gemmatimonadetes bacterium]|nr:hypothetical protein [Gemmatimonadota bacterium]
MTSLILLVLTMLLIPLLANAVPALRISVRGILGAVALAFLVVGSGPSQLSAQETSISGLFFGDYYYVAGHHDAEVEDANGFWARRMYLTIDNRFNSEWDARIRFEAGTKGDFSTSATMEPFLKDLYVRWRRGNHRILIGLSSSPTWSLLEGQWGYRDVEKTPMDLFKLGSSRDFGIAFEGSLDEAQKFRYHVMFGNGSSTKTETNKGKKIMGSVEFRPTENLILQAGADSEDRAGDQDRQSFTGTAILNGERGRVGLMGARQVRKAPGEDDVNVDVFSVFGVLDATERVNVLARYDRMATPIPDGAGISYFRMDPTSEGGFFLFGVDVAMTDNVHLIPNIEVVSYDDDALDSDIFLKTTFSIRF